MMLAGLIAALTVTAAQAVAPEVEIGREPVINTGAGLLENCTFESRASGQADLEFHLGLCIGFIKGVANAWGEQNPGRVCPPDELDNGRLRDVVVSWLRSHPQSLGKPAVGPVISATTAAFPCKAPIQVK